MSTPSPTFPWLRYWSRRGDRPTLADEYLVPPGQEVDWLMPRQTTTLRTLPQLADVPCLVLLGDPGTGKSNEIRAEFERLNALGASDVKVKLLDLKLRTESLIEKEVFKRNEFIGWTEGRHALVLFFDSMDECWRRVPELGPVILAEIEPYLTDKTKKRFPLYLRLGCRAAEWREELENSLRMAIGEETEGKKVQIWELAPLTKEDVKVAAKVTGLDADKFLAEVQAREVNAFAADPITLKMLLATAKEGGRLGCDRAEIYLKGCTLLCRDHHQPEKGAPRLMTTPQQRLACASYLASLCVLSNRYLIHGSTEQRPADEAGTICVQDIFGRKTLLPGPDFEFTREVLAETLQSGLFDAQPGEVYSWRHQSYAEYLAASYLQLRQIPPAEIVQSLCDTSSGVPRLWPQVEETACWLAMLMPEVFNQLVAANAEVFVRCDPVRLNPAQRAQIVTGYLDQVRRHDAQAARGREVSRLNRLAHPGLAAQLTPLLENTKEDIFVRDLAMDIVRACELREATDLLIKITLTASGSDRVRHGAAIALREWANPDIREKLKAQLMPEHLDDDDIRGCVLSVLWPASLTPEELILLLTMPERDNYVGSYQNFLHDDFRQGLAKVNLVPLIKWAKDVAEDSEVEDRSAYGRACEHVLLAAYHALHNADVRTEFMAVLKDHIRRHGTLFPMDGRDVASEAPVRNILWQSLIAGNFKVRETIISASLPESGLTHEDDFDWAMDQVASASGADREGWLELAFWLFQPLHRPEQIARMLPYAEADAAVAERMRLYTTCSLEEKDGVPNWQKDDHYRKEKRAAELAQRKPFNQVVDELLGRYESTQKPEAIWGLTKYLGYRLQDIDQTDRGNSSDLGWKHLTEEHRARIRALAPGFIATVKVDLEEVYNPKSTYWNYVAGVSYLLMLIEAGSPWPGAQPSEFWEAWTPLIIHYGDRACHADDAVWQKLLKPAFEKAKSAFLTALAFWLADRGDRWVPIKRLALLPIANDPELEAVLLANAVAAKRENETEFDFFGFLLDQKSAKAEETLVSWLRVERKPVHEKAQFADALLLNYRADAFGTQVTDRILADDAWGRTVFFRLSHMKGVPSRWLTAIDAERLARLWEWLDRVFPGNPYDGAKGDGTVTATHEIAMFRNQLIGYIEKRGTDDSVEAIRGLVLRHPDYAWLGQVLAEARQILRRESWKPPTAQEMIAYLARRGMPPLTNDADLADAVLASLQRYQTQLKGPRPLTELWNEKAGPVKVWTPKDEENLSNCLARHLERDIKPYGVRVARESELRQRTGSAPGDEPDLHVTAPSASGNGESLTVVVEAKCTWNNETITGMEKQLLDRYLRGLRCGIYVVAHFKCDSWSDTDARKTKFMSGNSLADVVAAVEAERSRLVPTVAKRLDAFVLDAGV